tara:strand:- start:162 stop:527 length:366 start_codon:yes stop_codon:yes gene_type:complete
MAAPNVVNVTSIYGKTVGATLTTSTADILVCPADKVLKVNSIIVSSIDASNAADVSAVWYNADNTTQIHIGKAITVPNKATLVLLGKDSPIYLEEGDKIQALASVASDLDMIISYEELDDA